MTEGLAAVKLIETAPALGGMVLFAIVLLAAVWRLSHRVLSHLGEMQARADAAEARCVASLAEVGERTNAAIDRNTAVVGRFLAWVDRAEGGRAEFRAATTEDTEEASVMSDDARTGAGEHEPVPGEPIYGIPEPPDKQIPGWVVGPSDLRRLAEDRDWGHGPLGIVGLHAEGVRGAGVLVAILDTGIDPEHPDLKARMADTGHRDFTGSPIGWRDRNNHGTHCAGIVAAADNRVGVIGAAPDAKLLAVKVLGDRGSGGSSGIAAGIRHAADTGADIISMSLGGPQPDTATRQAVDYAIGKGVWVVAAAGNDGPRTAPSFPGNYPAVGCVAAVGPSLAPANFSSRNREVDVAGPGVQIVSTLPGGRYGPMSGTSMATPYVAGCLALVRGELKKRGLRVPPMAEVLAAVARTSRDIPPAGADTATGAGLIQPAALLEHLAGVAPPPSPPPPGGKVVTLTHPDLTAAGVGEVSVRLAAAAAGPCPPKPAPLDGVLPDWLLDVARVTLPLLKKLAEKTETPLDDLLVDFLIALVGERAKARGLGPAAGYADLWPVVVEVLKALRPLVEEYVKGTPGRWDDLLVRLIYRLIERRTGTQTHDPDRARRHAARLAVDIGLPVTVAA